MQTVFIKFVSEQDRVRGFYTLATRSRIGSLPGAMVGSLLVGLLDNFGKALFPELAYFTLFAPMALILALRPTGLFGRT